MADLPPMPPPYPYPGVAPDSARGCGAQLLRCLVVVALVAVTYAACVLAFSLADPLDGAAWGIALGTLVCIVAAPVIVLIRRRPRRLGSAPWERDRAWGRTGDVRSALTRNLTGAGLWLCAFAAAIVWAILPRSESVPLAVFAAVACGVMIAVSLSRAWFQGSVEARWDEFPMRTGTRVRFHVATTAGGSALSALAVVLRCVEARRATEGRRIFGRLVTECPCLTPGPLSAGPEEFATVEFDVPADAPGTDLSRRGHERHWELIVRATTTWGAITETFLVPIYGAGVPAAGSMAAERKPARDAPCTTAWATEGANRYDAAHATPLRHLEWPAVIASGALLVKMLVDAIRGEPLSWARGMAMGASVLCLIGVTWSILRRTRREGGNVVWTSHDRRAPRSVASRRRSLKDVYRLILLVILSAFAVGLVAAYASMSVAAPVIAGVIWLATTAAFTAAVFRGRRRAVEVRWDASPLTTGSRVRLDVRTDVRLGANFRAALRAVRSPLSLHADYEVPADVIIAIAPTNLPDAPRPGEFASLEFDVPADAPGTLLTPGDETHWELVVLGDTARGPLSASVIVPIYADPAAAAAVASGTASPGVST